MCVPVCCTSSEIIFQMWKKCIALIIGHHKMFPEFCYYLWEQERVEFHVKSAASLGVHFCCFCCICSNDRTRFQHVAIVFVSSAFAYTSTVYYIANVVMNLRLMLISIRKRFDQFFNCFISTRSNSQIFGLKDSFVMLCSMLINFVQSSPAENNSLDCRVHILRLQSWLNN